MRSTAGVIEVSLGEIIERDLEEFLDLISERAFNTAAAMNVEYSIIGHRDHAVLLTVTADIEDDE
jgi:hypothetical protein